MGRGGWRVAEGAQLTRKAIAWSPQAVLGEQGQGRQDRRVYRSAAAVARRREGLQQRPHGVAGDAVFWQQQRPSRALSVKAPQKNMARDAKAAGSVARCPRVRQTGASHGLAHGAESVAIRAWLGPASLTSSARYAQASTPQVQQASRRTMNKVLQRSQV
jgi:site-specific recombinase XerD